MTATDHVVRELQRLGSGLIAGSWSRSAVPMSGADAMATMARGLAIVVRQGFDSVIGSMRHRLTGERSHPKGCTCILCADW